MGTTGGGVWITRNGGGAWTNISDGKINVGSIGAIDVADQDPNLVYVGTGAAPVRGVASGSGDGVYKSTDGGETWTHVGLSESMQISYIVIDPRDENTVFVGAQGNPYRPTEERGVYKSTDGGGSWDRVLFVNDTTGATDLKIDATNPRVFYASMWDHRRQPWEVRSGGEGSGLYKSVDGGENWEELTEGLPELKGKMGIAPSPDNPDRVWAIVEAKEKGGLYISNDGGESWSHVNGDRRLQSRSWYYMHIYADPQDASTVYVLNSGMYRSIDAGKTLESVRGPHGDYHNLWINPDDNDNIINASDGGGSVTYDGGTTWSSIYNQPTAQIYRLTVDNQFPYRLYGGQQDNSSVGIRSRGLDGRIGREDWDAFGGCESAFVGMDPGAANPRYYYANCYLGLLSEVDVVTGESRDVRAYPEVAFGRDASTRKYRFNWNSPVVVSAHDPSVIYHGGNMVLRSTDRGRSWEEISPDLTRDEEDKQGPGGRPITNEVSENYNTLAYLEESPHDANVLWAGTDDGKVQMTTDGGATWNDVTPRGMNDGLVNSIDVSPHDTATAYVAYTRYKYGDQTPVIYKTTNNGGRWRNIADGIPENNFVRVVREDPVREGLLFAGTERGVQVSFDGGDNWQALQKNLPAVPVTDMHVKGNDLAISTQGRGFWILDDISPLRTMSADMSDAPLHVFPPEPGFDFFTSGTASNNPVGNPSDGVWLHYYLGAEVDAEETPLKLEIVDADGDVVRTIKTKGSGATLDTEAGLHRLVWNLRADNLDAVEGVFSIAGGGGNGMPGPGVVPGEYTARFALGETVVEQPIQVTLDPRATATAADMAAHQALLGGIIATVTDMNSSFSDLLAAENQAKAILAQIKGTEAEEALKESAKTLNDAIKAWKDDLASTKREYFQDVLNWPDLLFSDLHSLYGTVNGQIPPITSGMGERYADLEARWLAAREAYDRIVAEDLAAFNAAYRDAGVDAIILPSAKEDED